MSEKKKVRIGWIAGVIAMLGLTAAFLSPWIADLVSPPAKPVEEEAVNFIQKIKDAVAAKAKGEEYEPEPEKPDPARFVAPSVIGLSLLGAFLGFVSLGMGEPKVFGIFALGAGIGGAVVQFSILITGVIIFLLIALIVAYLYGNELLI